MKSHPASVVVFKRSFSDLLWQICEVHIDGGGLGTPDMTCLRALGCSDYAGFGPCHLLL